MLLYSLKKSDLVHNVVKAELKWKTNKAKENKEGCSKLNRSKGNTNKAEKTSKNPHGSDNSCHKHDGKHKWKNCPNNPTSKDNSVGDEKDKKKDKGKKKSKCQKGSLLKVLTKHEKLFQWKHGKWMGNPVSHNLKEDAKPLYGRTYPIPLKYVEATIDKVYQQCTIGAMHILKGAEAEGCN